MLVTYSFYWSFALVGFLVPHIGYKHSLFLHYFDRGLYLYQETKNYLLMLQQFVRAQHHSERPKRHALGMSS